MAVRGNSNQARIRASRAEVFSGRERPYPVIFRPNGDMSFTPSALALNACDGLSVASLQRAETMSNSDDSSDAMTNSKASRTASG